MRLFCVQVCAGLMQVCVSSRVSCSVRISTQKALQHAAARLGGEVVHGAAAACAAGAHSFALAGSCVAGAS
jgi:6,7-dimethyl-8-ribityllumazine synthase